MEPEGNSSNVVLALMVVSATVLGLYLVIFTLLGKSIFELTLTGNLLVFTPVWLLTGSLLSGAVSIIVKNPRAFIKASVVLFSVGIVFVAFTLTLVFNATQIFWTE